jgi:hypothetical protein
MGREQESSSTTVSMAARPAVRLGEELQNSIIRAMAVLKDSLAMSSVTALIVLCSRRNCSVVGASSVKAALRAGSAANSSMIIRQAR